MSSNLAVEEPMAADPAKNPEGEELRGESSTVETTEEGEIRGSVETIVEEKTTVVVGETKEDLFGSELGSEGKPTGGLQGDDLLEVSLKNSSCVERGEVDGEEETNDPTEISLDDLTGGLDIDGKPTRGNVEEVVMESSVDNETDLAPSSTEAAGKAKDALVHSVSDEQIQDPENRPTEEVLEQSALEGFTNKEPSLTEGIREDETAEVGEYTSEKEVGEELEKGRLVDGDKLDNQISVEEIETVITPLNNVIEPTDTAKVLAEKNIGTSDKPNVDEGPVVEEYEEVAREVTYDSCIEPMNVTTSEVLAVGPVHVGTENVSVEMQQQGTEAEQPMDIDDGDTKNSETMETESGKEAGGDKLEVEAVETDANKEISILDEDGRGEEKEPVPGLEENTSAQAIATPDGKEAVVYHRREKHPTTKNTTSSPELQKETAPLEGQIMYNLPSVEKDRFAIYDLVWGKVKSHPWWPGVIINPSDGSNLAMKYQKKDAFLVAYFGDKTFAWCDESQLKPFFSNFSHFERQASSDAFSNAVRCVLVEVSRRCEVGSICSCLDKKLFAKEVYPKLENAGVRQGFVNCAVDRCEMVKYFNPKGLVDFIKDLALAPAKVTTDKLGLVAAMSQVKAFYWSKGYSVPPKYQTFGPLEDHIEPVVVPTEREKSPDNSVMVVQTPPDVPSPSVNHTPVELGTIEKPKRKRGRPPKKKKEELDIEVQTPLSELVQKKVHSNLPNGSRSSGKPDKTTTDDEDSASPLPWKKRKEVVGFDLVEPENHAQTPRSSGFGISFKIGACISRAASRLTGSGSGSSPLISTPKIDNTDFDVSSDDETPTVTPNEEKRVRRRRLKKYQYSDPKDVLSQLCLVAAGPTKECGFLGTVVSYFTDYRKFMVEHSPSTETNYFPEKVKSRRGRKRKVDLPQTPSDEVVTPTDHMQDSYWSDMILCGQSDEPSSGPKQRKRRVSIETKHLKLSPVGPDAKRALAVAEAATKRPIIRVEEKRVDECNPTALSLSFGTRYGTVPSEMDLVRTFSRYGPLKESEMGKVEGTTNRVWIVFKRRADAEMAFSSLRKQNVFGPSLLSYRLVYEVPEKSGQEKKVEVPNGDEHKYFELQASQQTVNLPSVMHGDYLTVDLANNTEGEDADVMLVDPSSNVEGNDFARGDVDERAVDTSSYVDSVELELASVKPSSNIVDVAQGVDVDEVPVDISSNVKDEDSDTMSVDPSSTVQIEPVTEMLIDPLSSTAEILVDPSTSMQVDTVTEFSVDHLSTVQSEAVNEILTEPSSIRIVEDVSEETVEPSRIMQVEAGGDVLITPSRTTSDEGANELSMNTSSTAQVATGNEVLANESGSVEDNNEDVEPVDLPSTDSPSTLHSEAAIDVLIVPASAEESEVVVEAPADHTTNEGKDVGITLVESSKTEQGALVSEMSVELISTEEGVVVGELPAITEQCEPDGIEQGSGNVDMPVEPSSNGEREVVSEMSFEQAKVFGAVPVEQSSTKQGEAPIEVQVDPSSTVQVEVVAEITVEAASTEPGKEDGKVLIEPSGTEQGIGDGERPVEFLSTEEGEVVGEMARELADTEQVKVGVPDEPSSIEQGEVLEVPADPSSTAPGGKVAEELVDKPVCSAEHIT